jgi:hypothetical protein
MIELEEGCKCVNQKESCAIQSESIENNMEEKRWRSMAFSGELIGRQQSNIISDVVIK